MSAAEEVDVDSTLWVWGTDAPDPKYLYMSLRSADLDRSLQFWVEGVGMQVFDRVNVEKFRAKVVMLGFPGHGYETGGMIELVRFLDEAGPYTHGTGFHHLCVSSPDVRAAAERLQALGFEMVIAPSPYMDGKGPLRTQFTDPDGYQVGIIQTTPAA